MEIDLVPAGQVESNLGLSEIVAQLMMGTTAAALLILCLLIAQDIIDELKRK